MSKDEIRLQLEQELKSPIWEKAKNSLVGRELISWAVETIYNLQLVDNAAYDYNAVLLEDMGSLIRRANTLVNTPTLTPIQTVKIINDNGTTRWSQLLEGLGGKEVYPYNLRYESGSATFYNIKFLSFRPISYTQGSVTQDQEFREDVVLYQGTPCRYYSNQEIRLKYDSITYQTNQINFEKSWSDNGGHYSNIVNLGKDVLVESIEVIQYDSDNEVIKLFHQFDPLEIGMDELSYRVQYSLSGDLYVWFGDGLWSKFVSESDTIQITFLRQTALDYSNTGKIQCNCDAEDPLTYNIDTDVKRSQMEFTPINRDALSFARKSVLAAYAERVALTSVEQVKNFIKGFDEVVDALVLSDSEANLDIKVITKYAPQLFDGVYYYLGLNAIQEKVYSRLSIFYSIQSMVSIPNVKIKLNIATSITDQRELDIIRNALAKEYQRSKYYFYQEFSPGSIIGDIRLLTGLVVSSVQMTLSGQSINSYKILTAVPEFSIEFNE